MAVCYGDSFTRDEAWAKEILSLQDHSATQRMELMESHYLEDIRQQEVRS